MIDTLLSVLAPHICCYCRKVGSSLCSECKDYIVSEPYEQCIWCESPTLHNNQCQQCAVVDAAWCVSERRDDMERLLGDLKFNAHRAVASELAVLLDRTLPLLPPQTVITYVPTSAPHRRQRGYDHAALIARRFAKIRGLEHRSLLARSHHYAQHSLGKKDRDMWAKQTFYTSARPLQRPVLLIDDIITTGATLRACSVALASISDSVMVAVVARQPSTK